MNLYKFNFDLAGSANAVQTITIPTDSKYSMGLKFFNGNEELVLSDDVKITIQDDKYIYTPTEIFNNYAVFSGSTGSDAGESKTYQVNFHKDADEDLPEVNANFKGVNVKTNDSQSSNWCISSSQMKVVYTDEWETMKDNADDRVIYFVVDRPTPPKPVPPKPVPPAPGGDWAFMLGSYTYPELTEDTTFDIYAKDNDNIGKFNSGTTFYKKVLGINDVYVPMQIASSREIQEGDYVKNDVAIPIFDVDGSNVQCNVYGYSDGKWYNGLLYKRFSSADEASEWLDNYYSEIDEKTPPFVADFDINDDWRLNWSAVSQEYITETDTYVWIEWGEDDYEKIWKNLPAYPQWASGEE